MNTNARRRGAKVAPSYYPRVFFHVVRSCQLISALIVGGLLGYFVYYLHREKYSIPWTFLVLLAVSFATVVALTLTIIVYNLTYLSPMFNCFLNGVLSIIWMTGYGLLSYAMRNSLRKTCDSATWKSHSGAVVCTEYRVLWVFTFLGATSTLSAFFLDISTQRRATSMGAYILPEDDSRDGLKMHDARSGKGKKYNKVKTVGYEEPKGLAVNEEEVDITYHSRYGSDEVEMEGYHDKELMMDHRDHHGSP